MIKFKISIVYLLVLICVNVTAQVCSKLKMTPIKKNGKPVMGRNNIELVTTSIVHVCCPGYKQIGNKCKPLCDMICENAKCTAPNVCTCNKGYTQFTQFRCQPYCSNCKHGVCTAPELCNCYPDYEKSNNGTCEAVCHKDCVNGYCSSPDLCACNEGYYLDEDFAIKNTESNKTICKPHCGHTCRNGYCSAPDICSCNEGFIMTSDGDCIPYCSSNCPNGICIGPELCICNPGYEMLNNTCIPICSLGCSNGYCSEPEICKCYENHEMKNGSVSDCEPICEPLCGEGQFCETPNKCMCLEGYEKNKEDKCLPKCPQNCINGNCILPMQCSCWEGYYYNDSDFSICYPQCELCEDDFCIGPNICKFDDTTTTEVEETSTEIFTTFISDIYYSTKFSATNEASNNDETSLCEIYCKNGICNNEECLCPHGYILSDDLEKGCISICDDVCDYDGFCHAENLCKCFEGFTFNETTCDSLCDKECSQGTCVLPQICNCSSAENKFSCKESENLASLPEKTGKAVAFGYFWVIFLLLLLVTTLVVLIILITRYRRKIEYRVGKREKRFGVVKYGRGHLNTEKVIYDEKSNIIVI